MIVHEQSRQAIFLLHSEQGERIQLRERMQLKEYKCKLKEYNRFLNEDSRQ